MPPELSPKTPPETPPTTPPETPPAAPDVATLQAQLTAATAERDALQAKADTLIGEKRSATTKLAETQKAVADAAKAQAIKDGDVAGLEQRLTEEHATALSAVNAELETARQTVYTMQVDNGLASALADANIAEAHRPAVSALLKSTHKIETGSDGATIDGKPLATFVTEWAASGTGKLYASAPGNGGSAAPGTPGGGSVSKKRSDMSAGEKGRFVRENGETAYLALPA